MHSGMIDTRNLASCLQSIGLDHWATALAPLLSERLSAAGHGDFERWRNILELNLGSAARYREPYLAEWTAGEKHLRPATLPERLRARRGFFSDR